MKRYIRSDFTKIDKDRVISQLSVYRDVDGLAWAAGSAIDHISKNDIPATEYSALVDSFGIAAEAINIILEQIGVVPKAGLDMQDYQLNFELPPDFYLPVSDIHKDAMIADSLADEYIDTYADLCRSDYISMKRIYKDRAYMTPEEYASEKSSSRPYEVYALRDKSKFFDFVLSAVSGV